MGSYKKVLLVCLVSCLKYLCKVGSVLRELEIPDLPGEERDSEVKGTWNDRM
jgi:hypothetical protein